MPFYQKYLIDSSLASHLKFQVAYLSKSLLIPSAIGSFYLYTERIKVGRNLCWQKYKVRYPAKVARQTIYLNRFCYPNDLQCIYYVLPTKKDNRFRTSLPDNAIEAFCLLDIVGPCKIHAFILQAQDYIIPYN